MKYPTVTNQDGDVNEQEAILNSLVNSFWRHGGEEKWRKIKKFNPDKQFGQWMKAHLMAIVDDSEISYE